MQVMKAWIAYDGSPGMFGALLILENGLVVAEHLCSFPEYMEGDLFTKKRKEALQRMGYEIEIQGKPVRSGELPDHVLEANMNQEALNDFAKEYSKQLDN